MAHVRTIAKPKLGSHFPNGRTLKDDVSGWMWAIVTKGRASDDGIGPHTDLLTDFPYLGPPHARSAPTLRRASHARPSEAASQMTGRPN
jgi:hypothetical protein